MPHRLAGLLAAIVFLVGCPATGPGVQDPTPTPTPTPTPPPDGPEEPLFSGEYDAPDWSALDDLDLPPGPDGVGFTLVTTPDATLLIDPDRRDANTAAGACVALLVSCYTEGVRNLTGCLDHVPHCATEQPWEEGPALCCPAGCADRYRALRTDGEGPPDAIVQAIWERPSCVPGMDDLLDRIGR